MVASFRDLLVWQKAMNLSVEIYQLTRLFPREEMYGLASQLRRSAVSVPSNIAEGQGRAGTKEFLQFLAMARGSLCEMQTQLEIARRVGLDDPESLDHANESAHEVGKLLYLLARSLKAKLT
ncbi:MAG: four helix bundle protein [Terracidiphilus sp.]